MKWHGRWTVIMCEKLADWMRVIAHKPNQQVVELHLTQMFVIKSEIVEAAPSVLAKGIDLAIAQILQLRRPSNFWSEAVSPDLAFAQAHNLPFPPQRQV